MDFMRNMLRSLFVDFSRSSSRSIFRFVVLLAALATPVPPDESPTTPIVSFFRSNFFVLRSMENLSRLYSSDLKFERQTHQTQASPHNSLTDLYTRTQVNPSPSRAVNKAMKMISSASLYILV